MNAAPATPDLAAVFARIAPLRGRNPDAFTVTPLPGYTNDNFRLQGEGHDWVLRIPKADTNVYIDRMAEAHNQALAADLGIAPAVIWRDDSGLSLTPTLAGRALRAEDLIEARHRLLVAETLSRLHRAEFAFLGRVDLAELIPRYFGLMPVPAQREWSGRLDRARASLAWLEGRDLSPLASHNDLILQNLLLERERLWLIDWEFSSMASPYWDLATLCNAASLTAADAADLLRCYCARGPQMEESVLCVYRELLQLLGDCWMAALVPEAT